MVQPKFCIQFTDITWDIVVLGKTIFALIFTMFFELLKSKKKRPVGLWKLRHGSTRSHDGLWKLRHGSTRSHDGFLQEPWRTPPRAMTDSSQSHDGFFTDPQVLLSKT